MAGFDAKLKARQVDYEEILTLESLEYSLIEVKMNISYKIDDIFRFYKYNLQAFLFVDYLNYILISYSVIFSHFHAWISKDSAIITDHLYISLFKRTD